MLLAALWVPPLACVAMIIFLPLKAICGSTKGEARGSVLGICQHTLSGSTPPARLQGGSPRDMSHQEQQIDNAEREQADAGNSERRGGSGGGSSRTTGGGSSVGDVIPAPAHMPRLARRSSSSSLNSGSASPPLPVMPHPGERLRCAPAPRRLPPPCTVSAEEDGHPCLPPWAVVYPHP